MGSQAVFFAWTHNTRGTPSTISTWVHDPRGGSHSTWVPIPCSAPCTKVRRSTTAPTMCPVRLKWAHNTGGVRVTRINNTCERLIVLAHNPSIQLVIQ